MQSFRDSLPKGSINLATNELNLRSSLIDPSLAACRLEKFYSLMSFRGRDTSYTYKAASGLIVPSILYSSLKNRLIFLHFSDEMCCLVLLGCGCRWHLSSYIPYIGELCCFAVPQSDPVPVFDAFFWWVSVSHHWLTDCTAWYCMWRVGSCYTFCTKLLLIHGTTISPYRVPPAPFVAR